MLKLYRLNNALGFFHNRKEALQHLVNKTRKADYAYTINDVIEIEQEIGHIGNLATGRNKNKVAKEEKSKLVPNYADETFEGN